MEQTLPEDEATTVGAAIEANWIDYLRAFGAAPGVTVRDDSEMFFYITGLPDGAFNSIMYAGLPAEGVGAAVAELRELRRRYRVPIGWAIGPGSRPPDLGRLLERHGLRHLVDLTPMVADLRAPPPAMRPAGLLIEAVENEEQMRAWTEAELLGFEAEPELVPGLRALRLGMDVGRPGRMIHYLARLGGEPAGTGTIVLSAGIAGLFDIATLPRARRRGVGAAMTAFLMRLAAARGYRLAYLNPSDIGRPLYERLGFRQVAVWPVYG